MPTLTAVAPPTLQEATLLAHFEQHGLTLTSYRAAYQTHPNLSLEKRDAQKIIANITGVVDRFSKDGLTLSDYLKAAVRQPPLFTQSPDTIAGNINRVVDRFGKDGLMLSDYLKAAIKQPPLFYQSPDTIIGHIDLMIESQQAGFFTLPPNPGSNKRGRLSSLFSQLCGKPILFCLSDDNFRLRQVWSAVSGKERLGREFLHEKRYKVEAKVMAAFGHKNPKAPLPAPLCRLDEPDIHTVPTRDQVLPYMARSGLLKSAKLG